MNATRRGAMVAGFGAMIPSPVHAAPMRIETIVEPVRARPFGADGPEIDAIGFDGVFGAGPLRLTRGAPVTLAIRNGLDRAFVPFLHGLRGAAGFQGVPGLTRTTVLAPGATEEATFTPRDAGTFLLRPFGDDALRASGFVRIVVVAEDGPAIAQLDQTLLIHDIPPGADVPAGVDRERDPLINGARPPFEFDLAAGGRARLRFVNGATRDRDAAGIRNGVVVMGSAMYAEIARDGTPLLDPYRAPSGGLVVRPGQRVDALLDAVPRADARVPLRPHDATFRYRILDGATPGGPHAPFRTPPAPPRPRVDLARATRVDLPITAAGDRLRLAGRAGDALGSAPLFRVPAGRTVVLRVEARVPGGALLHLQGHAAYVLDALDDGVQPWMLDTFDIPPDHVVTLAFRASERGRWYLGGVSRADMERGLAGWYEVT
jgi:FtsP/CotA-like multicopper oxidase with cupredoxin domain